MVRDNQLSREEALKLIEDERKKFEKLPEDTEDVLKRIDLEKSEFEDILSKKLPYAYKPPWYHGENKSKKR